MRSRIFVGEITIDGVRSETDVILNHGKIRKRNKKPSKKLQDTFGHTPLSAAEEIPGEPAARHRHRGLRQPAVMDDVKARPPARDQPPDPADRRGHQALEKSTRRTNAILHVTC